MHPMRAWDSQDLALTLAVLSIRRVFGHLLADTPTPGMQEQLHTAAPPHAVHTRPGLAHKTIHTCHTAHTPRPSILWCESNDYHQMLWFWA